MLLPNLDTWLDMKLGLAVLGGIVALALLGVYLFDRWVDRGSYKCRIAELTKIICDLREERRKLQKRIAELEGKP